MGNTSSSGRGHHEETVDFGSLNPQGVYTGPRDWNQSIVTQLIVDRKLAPFYRPLDDYEESWDDEQILAARKELPEPDAGDSSITRAESHTSSLSSRSHHKRPSAVAKEPGRSPEAAVYRGAVECPICFLYYPSNINYSRCCNQAICTECFVQIKRADPTTTHLVSEPACCPYCVQPNFGVVYTPPPWRAGIGSEGATPPSWPDSPRGQTPQTLDAPPSSLMKRRRKSFSAESPDVVTTDQIRPDWEAKLAAVRAAVTRRANRRIIMRQVGDRLIPVGVTSGRVHALPTGDEGQGEGGEGNGGADRGSRRSRRRQQNQDLNQLLGQMGIGGQDLEELMVMEAMRLSLLEHEEQQRKEREAEAKRLAEEAQAQGEGTGTSESTAPTASESVLPAASESPTTTTGPSPTSTVLSSASSEGPSISRTPDASGGSQGSPLPPPSANLPERASTDQLSPASPSQRGRQRRSSSISSLSEALRSVAAAAVAVGSPAVDEVLQPEVVSPSVSTTLQSATSTGTASALASPRLDEEELPAVSNPEPQAAETVPATLSPPAPGEENSTPASPEPSRTPKSTESSDEEAPSYNVLLSSATSIASSTSNKPLLEAPASGPDTGVTTNGDPSA
ncbi:unnamed protein product [Somion occarium]|uniref:RING-type domain-containing protein n=1 Tax=Somion occarium TaxID=3059160 RepID=A0ABP1D8N0_9APHY